MKSMVTQDVALNVFILVVQKMMETEFICPCDTSNNFSQMACGLFKFIIFFGILYISQYRQLKEDEADLCCCMFAVFLSGVLVVLFWLFVLFFDGNYYVCKMTS